MLTIRRISKAAVRIASKTRLQIQAIGGSAKSSWCPACEQSVVGFFAYGGRSWGCPSCGASPRERFVRWCLTQGLLALPTDARVLHMAPNEKSLAGYFAAHGDTVYADITPERYSNLPVVRLDLMNMDGVGQFDVFYASHVLEHVPDDYAVLRNIYGHLNPGGQAWILVPISGSLTVDGASTMSAKQREQMFGQWDHLRLYGTDLVDRMRSAGLCTRIIEASRIPSRDRLRMGISDTDMVFVGRRNTR